MEIWPVSSVDSTLTPLSQCEAAGAATTMHSMRNQRGITRRGVDAEVARHVRFSA